MGEPNTLGFFLTMAWMIGAFILLELHARKEEKKKGNNDDGEERKD